MVGKKGAVRLCSGPECKVRHNSSGWHVLVSSGSANNSEGHAPLQVDGTVWKVGGSKTEGQPKDLETCLSVLSYLKLTSDELQGKRQLLLCQASYMVCTDTLRLVQKFHLHTYLSTLTHHPCVRALPNAACLFAYANI